MKEKTLTRLFTLFISLIFLLSLVKCSSDIVGVGTRDGYKAIDKELIKTKTE